MSLIQQSQCDETLKQYYQILRCRQSQIIGIIKETTDLVETLGAASESSELDKSTDRKIKLAFSMINALSNILDEQMKALNIWERILCVEESVSAEQPQIVENGARSYYKIGTN